MRYALMLPPTVPIIAKIDGNVSQINRTSPKTKIAIMKTGTNQRIWSPSRARSKPLTESFIPTQLSCTQGKKKHIRTKPARLSVERLVLFTSRSCVDHIIGRVRLSLKQVSDSDL